MELNASFLDYFNLSMSTPEDTDEAPHIFLGLFIVFFICVIFSSTANGFLFYITTRYRIVLWQPSYALLKHLFICGIGLNLLVGPVVSVSVLQKQTQAFGTWCITQFCLMRFLFFASYLTVAFMAIERYIYICHGFHYLRLVNSRNIHQSIGFIWLVCGVVSSHGGFVLSRMEDSFKERTCGLLCEPVIIMRQITSNDSLEVFGPPFVIMLFCVLAIIFCYGSMYHAALKVTKELKCSNQRANRTVGFYFLMFLLQLALNITGIVLSLKEKDNKKCGETSLTSILVPLMIIVPFCINPVFLLVWNPEMRQLLFLTTSTSCQLVFQASPPGNTLEMHAICKKRGQQTTKNTLSPSVSLSIPEDVT